MAGGDLVNSLIFCRKAALGRWCLEALPGLVFDRGFKLAGKGGPSPGKWAGPDWRRSPVPGPPGSLPAGDNALPAVLRQSHHPSSPPGKLCSMTVRMSPCGVALGIPDIVVRQGLAIRFCGRKEEGERR